MKKSVYILQSAVTVAMAAVTVAAEPKQPNVLLLVCDDLRPKNTIIRKI